MSNVVEFSPTIPSYAVDLLLAAKCVIDAQRVEDPECLSVMIQRLEKAIDAFEKEMPIRNGQIQER